MPTAGEHDQTRTAFSLVAGGPFYRLLCAARLTHIDCIGVLRPALAVLAVAWLPLLLLTVAERLFGRPWDPILTDPSVWVRFWLTVPLFFVGEYALHVRCTRAADRFMRSAFVGEATTAAVARALQRAERRRDKGSVELGLLTLALAGGQITLWGMQGGTGLVDSAVVASETPVLLWYAVVSLPLYQFLFARWLWRWVIWTCVLVDFSRLKLQLAPLHPDRAAGLGMLNDPVYAFACFAAGNSAVVSGAWATMLADGAEFGDFVVKFAIWLLLMLILAFGPLLVFFPRMLRARFEGHRDHGLVALHYVRLFRARWVEHAPDDDTLLGAPDIQSLADMQGSFQSMAQMRIVPFGPRALIVMVLSVGVPFVPLALFQTPIDQLLLEVGKAALGGLP